jgi:translocation and assembly module TamB
MWVTQAPLSQRDLLHPHQPAPRARRLAQFFCLFLAAVGALPVLLGLVMRTDRARLWAEQQTAQLLFSQLGIRASYRARVNLWPLELRVEDLVVPSNDGGPAALRVKELRIAPRMFALLAGRLDIGTVRVDSPELRLVVEQGALKNVSYHLPVLPKTSPGKPRTTAPFSSIALSDAHLDLTIAGRRVETEPIDLDILAERGLAFEIAVRSAGSTLSDHRPRVFVDPFPAVDAYDEDILCELELRARITEKGALVRRLVLGGFVDLDPKLGTRPMCKKVSDEHDPSVFSLRMSQVAVDWAGPTPTVDGQIALRAPVGLVNRYVPFLPVSGWVGLHGHARWDRATRLPKFEGKLRGENLVLERYRLAQRVDADVTLAQDEIRVPDLDLVMADGRTHVHDMRIRPFEPDVPISVKRVTVDDSQFPGLMRDLGVTEKTIVAWDFGETVVTDLQGRLALPELEGHIHSNTRDFEIYDRGFADPARKHMIGIPRATVDGRILVTPTALEFHDCLATFGRSRLFTNLVRIGFSNELEISVGDNSTLNLADISPIVNIPVSGQAKLGVHLKGRSSDPLLLGKLSVQNLVFGGFPVGDIASSDVKFWPLKVDFSDVKAQKGQSQFTIESARLQFDRDAAVVIDAHAKSRNLEVRDFLAMWNFAEDPRYAEIRGGGAIDAIIHYALGGAEDHCGGGILRVDAKLALDRAELFGERYDSAAGEMSFVWSDPDAGFLGTSIDVQHLSLRKGAGAILGSFQVRPGARLTGQAVATKLPLNRFDLLAPWASFAEGEVSAVAELGGTLDAMTGTVQVSVTPIHIGAATLPASDMTVQLESVARRWATTASTRCGQPIPPPFDLAEYRADKPEGAYRASGQLLGGQLSVENLLFSRQRDQHIRGKVNLHRLDVGSLVEALPASTRPDARTVGALTGQMTIEDLSLGAPKRARGQFLLSDLVVEQGKLAARVLPGGGPIRMAEGRVDVPGLVILTGVGGLLNASLDVSGSMADIEREPKLTANVHLRPVDLEPLSALVPGVDRLAGVLAGEMSVDGPWAALKSSGTLGIERGEVELHNFDVPITGIELRLGLSGNELRIDEGRARVGSGSIELRGSAPVVGSDIGFLRATLKARNMVLPERFGIKGLADADLETMFDPRSPSSRPRITGQVWLDALEYSRPVTMTADVAALTQRGRRSNVEAYDPADDVVDFDLQLFARRPLRIHNGLIEAEMEADKAGLQLVGSNQRFGLRGNVRALPGGRVSLRQTVFEIREGQVKFDDSHRILPRVDVRATTDYRRYSSHASGGTTVSSASSSGSSSSGSVAGATGGQWRITMHAHGDADQLRIDLTSDPALSEDDIFLLLTIGVTRAELDQAQSASVYSSVALEALGTLSGADRAVTETIPLIDDFRFGSAYSARTGRTEPTVTIGKRLADRIRASVTSGMSESREVRSNVEWRLNRQLSVEGSYDNVNDISMSQLGNLGADVRWRLEFR